MLALTLYCGRITVFAIAIIGAVTVVLSAHTSDARLTPEQILEAISQTPFEVFACVYIVGAFVLVNLSARAAGDKYVLIDVGCCALFGKCLHYPSGIYHIH